MLPLSLSEYALAPGGAGQHYREQAKQNLDNGIFHGAPQVRCNESGTIIVH